MRVSNRITWVIHLCGFALAAGLFAVYASLRPRFGPFLLSASAEAALVFFVLAAAAGLVIDRSIRRHSQRVLYGLSEQVAELRRHPAAHRVQELPAELGPLQQQLEALSQSYRQALDEVVEAKQALNALRALQVKADAEKGHSHSFVHAGIGTGVMHRMVARLTPSLHWLAATPALQLFVGSSLNDLVARSFLDIVHPEDRPGVARAFQEVLRDGEGHDIVFRVRLLGSMERYVQMDALARYTEAGSPLHLRCHLLDITDRVRTEQELRRRTEALYQANVRLRQINSDLERLKESYRDLYHQAPVMYFSLDEHGRFAALNETFTRALGWTRQDLFGQPYVRVLTPASRERYLHDPSVYHRAGEVEAQWVKRDGTVIDVWVRSVPILDLDGRFIRSRSAGQDVTERNRLAGALRAKAEELERANTQLRRINQELDQFTYVVSHDLKEPLRSVQAFSTFLRRDFGPQLEPEGQEYIDHLLQASGRLGALIDDLLTLSRAGRVLNPPQAFALAEVVQMVCRDLHNLIQRRQAVVRVEGPLPIVLGDPERVAQLLANLVANGLKYNTDPRPEVVIGALRIAEGQSAIRNPQSAIPEVVVFVRDNGIGIDPEYHEQIFGIFRRLHRRDEYEGTGAGLAICKKIVESHGGRIWVESQPGAGATFYFTLPRPGEEVQIADGKSKTAEDRNDGAAQSAISNLQSAIPG